MFPQLVQGRRYSMDAGSGPSIRQAVDGTRLVSRVRDNPPRVKRMNSKCLVSVIIPCFNAGEYLARAVRSALAQGMVGTEVIIVDDRSTDGSKTVAEDLANRLPGVRLVQQPANAGPAAARNTALHQASGRYVCFLDADDEYAPGFFAAVLPPLEQDPDLAAVTTGVELVNCHRDVHPVQLEAVASSLPSNVMVRKAVADLVGGFPEAPAFRGQAAGEDVCFRQTLARWFKVAHCPGKFLRYLVKRGSHLDYFLDRSQVVDGQIVFTRRSPEETNMELAAALRAYSDPVGRRLAALRSTGANAPAPRTEVVTVTINNHSFTLRYPYSPAMHKVCEDVFHGEYGLPDFLRPEAGAVLDIGANVGCMTLLLHVLYPNATVFACEPCREAFTFLQANAGSLANVRLFGCGLYDRDCTMKLYHGGESSVTNSVCHSAHNTGAYEVVTLRRASSFLSEQGIDRIVLLKLDTEGAELPILRDLGPWLDRTAAVALEYHSEEDRIEIDRLLSGRFGLFQGKVHHLHRGTLVYVAKEVLAARTNLNTFRIAPPSHCTDITGVQA
jgi:FkbM family methyltransferase